MFFNRLTAFVCVIIISVAAAAQGKEPKVKFGDIKPDDFKPEYYSIDSSAEAVFLYDVGATTYEGNNNGWFSVVFKVHERIRLLNKKSFEDLGTVKLSLYVTGTTQQKLKDLQAATYYMEDGKLVTAKVDKNSIFKDKDGSYQVVKFTFPNLKEGAIIEYIYTIESPVTRGNEFIPSWPFQGNYPRLWSAYTIEVPQFFEFVTLNKGYLVPVIDTANRSADNFNLVDPNGTGASQSYSFRSSTIKHTWAFADVPVLKDENYITDLSNYRQSLEFQLSAHRFPNSEPQFFTHTWYETVDQLMKSEQFGEDLNKENGWLKDDVKAATQGETDALKKAKKIYGPRITLICTDFNSNKTKSLVTICENPRLNGRAGV